MADFSGFLEVENIGAYFRAERAEAENDLDLDNPYFFQRILFLKKGSLSEM